MKIQSQQSVWNILTENAIKKELNFTLNMAKAKTTNSEIMNEMKK